MSPLEDDPDVWVIGAKFFRAVWRSLDFMHPFLMPAFIGAVLSVSRSYRKKGFAYWCSAVLWSTLAGAALAPVFTHYAGVPLDAASSCATLIALLGHSGVGWLCGKFENRSAWDGTERRKGNDEDQV